MPYVKVYRYNNSLHRGIFLLLSKFHHHIKVIIILQIFMLWLRRYSSNSLNVSSSSYFLNVSMQSYSFFIHKILFRLSLINLPFSNSKQIFRFQIRYVCVILCSIGGFVLFYVVYGLRPSLWVFYLKSEQCILEEFNIEIDTQISISEIFEHWILRSLLSPWKYKGLRTTLIL